MPARPLPNLLLQAFFDLGEDGWKDEMDLNLLKLSVLTQAGTSGKFAAEPGAPAAGTIIVLDETHATHPNAVAVYDDGAWVYFTPTEGWLIYNQATDSYLVFSGAVWGPLVTGAAAVKYRMGFSIEGATPTAAEVMLRHVLQHNVTFADDFVGSVARKRVGGGNPGTAQAFSILHNNVAVGTLTLSTGGVFTFATTGGALVALAGDEIRVEAPAAPDAALVGVSVTLFGLEA